MGRECRTGFPLPTSFLVWFWCIYWESPTLTIWVPSVRRFSAPCRMDFDFRRHPSCACTTSYLPQIEDLDLEFDRSFTISFLFTFSILNPIANCGEPSIVGGSLTRFLYPAVLKSVV